MSLSNSAIRLNIGKITTQKTQTFLYFIVFTLTMEISSLQERCAADIDKHLKTTEDHIGHLLTRDMDFSWHEEEFNTAVNKWRSILKCKEVGLEMLKALRVKMKDDMKKCCKNGVITKKDFFYSWQSTDSSWNRMDSRGLAWAWRLSNLQSIVRSMMKQGVVDQGVDTWLTEEHVHILDRIEDIRSKYINHK